MIEPHLTESLCEFLEKTCTEFRLPTRSGGMRSPKVFSGYLPLKRSTDDEDFPFLLVRVESATTDVDATEVEAVIVVGCYLDSPDMAGYAQCLDVVARIRNALARLSAQTLAGRYQLRLPFKWENIQEQPFPHWQVEITTTWLFQNPRPWEFD